MWDQFTTSMASATSIDIGDVRQSMRHLARLHDKSVRSGVQAASKVQCDQCPLGAAYTDKPSEGFVVCEHILEEIKRLASETAKTCRGGRKPQIATIDRLMGLAVYTWPDWFAAIPPRYMPGFGDQGQITWKLLELEIQSLTPTEAELRTLAEKHPPPQEWFDEDEECPF